MKFITSNKYRSQLTGLILKRKSYIFFILSTNASEYEHFCSIWPKKLSISKIAYQREVDYSNVKYSIDVASVEYHKALNR